MYIYYMVSKKKINKMTHFYSFPFLTFSFFLRKIFLPLHFMLVILFRLPLVFMKCTNIPRLESPWGMVALLTFLFYWHSYTFECLEVCKCVYKSEKIFFFFFRAIAFDTSRIFNTLFSKRMKKKNVIYREKEAFS